MHFCSDLLFLKSKCKDFSDSACKNPPRMTQFFSEDKHHSGWRQLSNMFTSYCIIFNSSTDYGFLVHSITNSCDGGGGVLTLLETKSGSIWLTLGWAANMQTGMRVGGSWLITEGYVLLSDSDNGALLSWVALHFQKFLLLCYQCELAGLDIGGRQRATPSPYWGP